MSAKPIIQGQEFPVITPTSIKDIDEIPVSVDQARVTVLPGSTKSAASFQFEGEDHTLGNALRYIIMKNPDVEFCGYSIPHPSEAKMNIRIQSYDDVDVHDILDKGLQDLMDMCDVVTEKFTIAKEEFHSNKMQS
ncbi:DNA-directed RNA polymerase I and III 14 KDA polypeptide [Karstenula rhodostoma CBS 690.94]|uniref:DNA-directed RNA polymerases I and III subunit RPAC2 n=1 Tax=Karstenula rhodostoma CBS 690.94 TaxID=1392251 RepID=A0A9P4PJ89_9PLEO|nr:DNA-directed RNA polymerase I and III 14 KDA polypeptide [Karstenula rhodostoma CBS 690.94]